MANPHEQARTLSFVIKIWLPEHAQFSLRGRITRVSEDGTDKVVHFTKVSEIAGFIVQTLEENGFQARVRSPFWWWLFHRGR